jgi:hypothetical protein
VIITSRFKKTIISLNINKLHVPEYDKEDAKNLFLYYVVKEKEFGNKEDVEAIEKCTKSCYFGKFESQGSHYHPISLKALGVFL